MREGRGQGWGDSRDNFTCPSCCPFSLESPVLVVAIHQKPNSPPCRSPPDTQASPRPHLLRAGAPATPCCLRGHLNRQDRDRQPTQDEGSAGPATCQPNKRVCRKMTCKVQVLESDPRPPVAACMREGAHPRAQEPHCLLSSTSTDAKPGSWPRHPARLLTALHPASESPQKAQCASPFTEKPGLCERRLLPQGRVERGGRPTHRPAPTALGHACVHEGSDGLGTEGRGEKGPATVLRESPGGGGGGQQGQGQVAGMKETNSEPGSLHPAPSGVSSTQAEDSMRQAANPVSLRVTVKAQAQGQWHPLP